MVDLSDERVVKLLYSRDAWLADFIFVNLRNYSSWSVTWVFSLTCEELLTDIRDFTTLFYVILRREYSKWLELFIERDLGMQFAIWSLDLTFHEFTYFEHSFLCKKRLLKRVPSLLSWFGKTIFFISVIRDPWSVIRDPCMILCFCRSWTVPEIPLYDPLMNMFIHVYRTIW